MPPPRPPRTTRRRVVFGVVAIAALAAAVRIPFIWSGIGADEGGYAFIAHEWAHGAHLYRDLFVDRPQGLILLYRGLTSIAYEPWAIRLGAVLAGVAMTLLVGGIGWMLRSRATGVAAAIIFAVAGVAPHTEAFTMEGELAAAVPAAAAVACAVRWRIVERDRWLVGAGFLGAAAVLTKQSGFDGIVVAIAVAAAAAGALRARLRRVGLVLGAAAVPVAAAVIHGLSLGWSSYWLGVYGWRAQEDLGRGVGARISDLADQIGQVAPDLWGLALVAAAGLVVALRARRSLWIAPLWLLVCLVAINAGGLYLPHYFIQLLAPLVLLAGLAVSAAGSRSTMLAVSFAGLAVLPVVITLADFATMSPQQRAHRIRWGHRYDVDLTIARFIHAHSNRGDRIFAVPSRADLYFLADRLPPIPYLWEHTPLVRADTIATLRRKLAAPHRPKFVVVVENARPIDSSGRLNAVVARYYRDVWRPPGVTHMRVLLARGAAL